MSGNGYIVSLSLLFGEQIPIPEREPHFHKKGHIMTFVSTPRALCPLCAMEWKEEGYREEIKRLHALLRTDSTA